jgi:hypothetical protein
MEDSVTPAAEQASPVSFSKSLDLKSVIQKMQPASLQLEPFPVIPSPAHLEAKVALKRVEELKAMVGADAPSLQDITL